MSAVAAPHAAEAARCWLAQGRLEDIDAIMALEESAHPHPWTRSNMLDILGYQPQVVGYAAQLLWHQASPLAQPQLWGYWIALRGVDEMHLLNLSVAPAQQGRGCARLLLQHLRAWAQSQNAAQIWLEVRSGNARARSIYTQHGFVRMGLRKNYYPAGPGQREDAIVMCLSLEPARDAPAR